MEIIICTLKSWNIQMAENLQHKLPKEFNITINSDKDTLIDLVKQVNPRYIFFPHWSYIIPKQIYDNYECIVFHMTDLPFGRGGSPLQNLIVRGIENTKISALRVSGEIDAGPIYLKERLNLNGNAEEIFIRASKIIYEKMIPEILMKQINPIEQTGDIVEFSRRKPFQSEINSDMSLQQIYDYIRMLDAEGYPKSYISFGKYKLNFTRASLRNGKILADVEIMEENTDE